MMMMMMLVGLNVLRHRADIIVRDKEVDMMTMGGLMFSDIRLTSLLGARRWT